jgi:hypothetical protein
MAIEIKPLSEKKSKTVMSEIYVPKKIQEEPKVFESKIEINKKTAQELFKQPETIYGQKQTTSVLKDTTKKVDLSKYKGMTPTEIVKTKIGEIGEAGSNIGKSIILSIPQSFYQGTKALFESEDSKVSNLSNPAVKAVYEKVKKEKGEQAAEEFLSAPLGEGVKELDNKIKDLVNKPIVKFSNDVLDILDNRQQTLLKDIFDEKEGLSNPAEYSYTIASGAVSLVEAIGIYALTKNANITAGVLSSAEATSVYQQARDSGKTPSEARKLTAQSGVGTFLLEKIGLDYLFKTKIGGKLLNAVKTSFVETAQEEGQTVWQNAVAKNGYDKSIGYFDGWWETAVAIAIPSFGAGMINYSKIDNQRTNLVKDVQKKTGSSLEEASKFVNNLEDKIVSESKNIVEKPIKTKQVEGQIGQMVDATETLDVSTGKITTAKEAEIAPVEEITTEEEITPTKEEKDVEGEFIPREEVKIGDNVIIKTNEGNDIVGTVENIGILDTGTKVKAGNEYTTINESLRKNTRYIQVRNSKGEVEQVNIKSPGLEVYRQKTLETEIKPSELELIKEVKKYKSAEEFADNNDLIFQGRKQGAGESSFWTTNLEEAKRYSGENGTINVSIFSDMPNDLKMGLSKKEYISQINPHISVNKERQPQIIGKINPKSQLTDIWNKANIKEISTKAGTIIKYKGEDYTILQSWSNSEGIGILSIQNNETKKRRNIKESEIQKETLPLKQTKEFKEKYKKELEEITFEKPKKKQKAGGVLGFNPKNTLENPKSPEFKKETDKIIKRSEIAKEITEKFGFALRTGKYKGKAIGIYKVGKEIIRIKSGNIQTLAHEIGHYIDEKFPGVFSSNIKNSELKPLLEEYGKENVNKHKEAFSEFLRFYIAEPNKAKSKAPIFYKSFEKSLEKLPEVKEAILTMQQDYQRWLSMPSVSKVLSQISEKEQQEGIGEKISGTIEKIYESTLDDLYPIKKYVELAKKEGIEIPDEENPYVLARVQKGFTSKANVFLEKGTFNKKFWVYKNGKATPVFTGKGLRQILNPIAKKKGGLQDLSVYLISKRAVDLNKRDIMTGISTIDANNAIKELEAKYPEFNQASKDIYDFQDAVLEYGKQSGLYDDKFLETIKEKNKNYVPFYRVMEDLQSGGYFGKGYGNVGKKIKRIKGSEKEIINPLESIVKNTYVILEAADRNSIALSMYDLSKKNAELGKMFEEIPSPMSKVASVSVEELKNTFGDGVLSTMSEEDQNKVLNIFRPSAFISAKENITSVLVNGKPKYFQVDPDLYRSMMATEREDMGVIMKILSTPAQWLRAGSILAPEFVIRNPLRDLTTAWVYSRYGFVPLVDNAKAIASMIKRDDIYYLWKMGGGEQAALTSLDRTSLKGSFEEIAKGKQFTDFIKNPVEALRILSEISEKMNRIPEAAKAIKLGKSPIEAAYASRDITLDFAKGGTTGRAINRIIAFWKAWALGWEKLYQNMKLRPVQTTTKAVMAITLPSILLWLANHDDERYKEIPQWQKDMFWIIMTDDKIYRIPKPFELGLIFGSIPERFLDFMYDKDPKAIKELVQTILFEQAPGVVPTALEPLIENWSNYDFFTKRQIVSDSLSSLPAFAQYNTSTSETAKILGEKVGLSPLMIDNIWNGYTSSLGKYGIDAIDSILVHTGIAKIPTEPTKRPEDTAILRAFLVKPPIGSNSESVNTFYDKLNEYQQGEKLLKFYIKENQEEKFNKYKEAHPEINFQYDYKEKSWYSVPARYYRKIADTMSEGRAKEHEVYISKDLTADEKRKKIDEIETIITEMAQETLKLDKEQNEK